MSKFKNGAPQLRLSKRNGGSFKKTYHSVGAANASAKAWRKRGGRVISKGIFFRAGRSWGKTTTAGRRIMSRGRKSSRRPKGYASKNIMDASGQMW